MTAPVRPAIITGGSEHPPEGLKTIMVPGQPADVQKIFTLADVDPIGRSEVIIYGPPGSGKSVIASTFPGPHRWIAADGPTCLKSVRWAFKAGKSAVAKLEDLKAYVPSEDYDKGVYASKPAAFNRMTDMIDFWFSPAEVGQWETLVLDSATEINEWALNMGLEVNVRLPDPKKPLSTSHTTNQMAKLRILTGQQDYKSAMALFEGFLSDLRVSCAKHGKCLVVLCHEWVEDYENDDGVRKIIKIEPLLLGQLRTRVLKSFDDVWYMQSYVTGQGIEVKVRVHPDHIHLCKTRWGDILKSEEVPDYRQMLAKVKAYHEAK